MQNHEEQFLFLLKSYFNNEKLPDGYRFDVVRVFSLAATHNMLPIVLVKAGESAEDLSRYKRSIVTLCGNQISKNIAFEALFETLMNENINAVVVKGPICALCFPEPDMRLSSDFDIVVSEDDRDKLHAILLSQGFSENNSAYISKNNGLYLEVSTELGEGNGSLKEKANKVFDGFLDRAICLQKYRTLSVTDHLAYLIYHAYKHFIGSGFGVRQLIDIYMFIKVYGNEIDYNVMNEQLHNLGITNFAFNVFYAIEKIFNADISFLLKNADEKILCFDGFLSDLLCAGVFGKSSEDRLHSASVVLSAVENAGKKSVNQTIFPPFAVMRGRYRILKKFPFLLPVFWLYRLIEYLFKALFGKQKVSPQKSIEIANERIELMKKMGII